jgi:hypothetical protein
MAITRGATYTSQNTATDSESDLSFTHTVDTGTTLLLVFIGSRQDEVVSAVTWDVGGAAESLSLVQSRTGANTGDHFTACYAYTNPTAKTATMTVTLSGVPFSHVHALNYLGTNTSATMSENVSEANYIINLDPQPTSTITSAGTSGNTLVAFGSFRGGDGTPVSNDELFVELQEGTTGAATSSDATFYLADKIGAAPSGITINWTG